MGGGQGKKHLKGREAEENKNWFLKKGGKRKQTEEVRLRWRLGSVESSDLNESNI